MFKSVSFGCAATVGDLEQWKVNISFKKIII